MFCVDEILDVLAEQLLFPASRMDPEALGVEFSRIYVWTLTRDKNSLSAQMFPKTRQLVTVTYGSIMSSNDLHSFSLHNWAHDCMELL